MFLHNVSTAFQFMEQLLPASILLPVREPFIFMLNEHSRPLYQSKNLYNSNLLWSSEETSSRLNVKPRRD